MRQAGRQAGNGKRFGGEWRRMVCSGLLNRDFNRSFASISRAYMEISDMPKDGREGAHEDSSELPKEQEFLFARSGDAACKFRRKKEIVKAAAHCRRRWTDDDGEG